jgi:signal transduction histidine kinase
LVDYNDAAEAITDGKIRHFLGKTALEMYADMSDVLDDFSRLLAGDASINREMLYRFRSTGEVKNLAVRYARVPPDQVVVLTEDITERKQTEAILRHHADSLRSLSRRLVEVQEEERRHIARELHDQIGQVLTNIRFLLERRKDSPGEISQDDIGEALARFDGLVNRIRDLCFDLRPALLDQLGLLPALLGLFDRYKQQTGIEVHFKHNGIERRFTPDLETGAFRVIQESLTNVARHAKVKEADVHVWADSAALHAQVVDHGVGFNLTLGMPAESCGLTGMRERVALLGGELTIETMPGEGTCVTTTFPLLKSETNTP